MTKIKAFTNIQQSKKLAEILPHESADMVYLRCDFEDEGEYSILVGSYHEGYTQREDGTIVPVFDEHIPAWSLAALLDILPILDNRSPVIPKTFDGKYRVTYHSTAYERAIFTSDYDNPVDACYEMILKLHELKML